MKVISKQSDSKLPLGLPEELADWVLNNQDMIQRIQEAQTKSYATLAEMPEDEIWPMIAAASGDAEFLKSHQEMLDSKKVWDHLNHPLNKPLGAIGRAFESDKTNAAHEHYLAKLAEYTFISEGLLKSRPDLGRLLNVLLVQKRMLEQSQRRTREIKEAAAHLAEMFSLRRSFSKAAKRSIGDKFRKVAEFLKPKKQFNATSAPVPWPPGM